MSHDYEPEPHEKAMIDVMLKSNSTPTWVYEFNKFLIDERPTGEIIEYVKGLLTAEYGKGFEDGMAAANGVYLSIK